MARDLATAVNIVGIVASALDAHGVMLYADALTFTERVNAVWTEAVEEIADLLDPDESFDVEIVDDEPGIVEDGSDPLAHRDDPRCICLTCEP